MSDVIVYVVICIDDDENEIRHIFSTAKKARAFSKNDRRAHVFYNYVLDCPERHEGSVSVATERAILSRSAILRRMTS